MATALDHLPGAEKQRFTGLKGLTVLGQLVGAVAVVSGNIAGQTQTLPLFIEDANKQYDTELAYGAALILGGVGLVTLLLKLVVEQVMGGVKESKPIN
jgi:sulfate transport system permease protein